MTPVDYARFRNDAAVSSMSITINDNVRRNLCGMCGMCAACLCGIETITGEGLCGMCGIAPYGRARNAPANRPTPQNSERARTRMPHMPHMPHSPYTARPAAVRHDAPHTAHPFHAAQTRSRACAPTTPRHALEVGKGGPTQ